MIYECKVYDAKGKLKKVVSAEKCKKQYWDGFQKDKKESHEAVMKSQITKDIYLERNKE